MKSIIAWLAVTVIFQLLGQRSARRQKHEQLSATCPPPEILPEDIVVDGEQFDIEREEIHRMLSKRFPYYVALNDDLKHTFIRRLMRFMSRRIFIIKDREGFREMPVLVSAAAVQLTFGLKQYDLLSFYRYIQIYPEEYFRKNSFLEVMGNVQDNMITVAWNHFLKGYEQYTDGTNVGLHEMSHALYVQKMVVDEGYGGRFKTKYEELLEHCEVAAQLEKAGLKDTHSSYADIDLQEFWAESVEVFFEKPAVLYADHPEVYEAVKLLLNQDPMNAACPVLIDNLTLKEKLAKAAEMLRKR